MSVLVISPHPDDETLGAGGTMLRYKDEGKKVYWLNITNMSQTYGYSEERKDKRIKQIEQVKKMYNVDGYYDLQLEPTALDKYDKSEVVSKISKVVNKTQAETIILPYYGDVHSDHQIAFDAIYSCTKVFRYPFVKRILCMEILSETDFAMSDNGFVPNYFIDVEKYMDKKLEIMKIYESEVGTHPFPRSIETLKAQAMFRGASCGRKYAEAYRMIKQIE